jgi:flagellar hook assembly protein FlgD
MGAHEYGSIPWTGITEKKVGSRQSAVVSYPNPSSNFTTFEYKLEQSAKVNLSIYNHLGQLVAVLADGEQAAGRQQVRWQAEGMPAGIYFFRLTTDDYRLTTGKLVRY